jgi:CRISPR system Cascade subunit CasC
MQRVAEIGRESTKKASEEVEEDEAADTPGEEKETAVSKQLIFIGRDELRPLAVKLRDLYKKAGAEKWNNPKKLPITDITKGLENSLPRSVDIAMFGRMTTSSVFENVSAAVQVAHALSTNALSQEFDYYTAVDDLSGESGAGMIGDIEFNSSTYYKYLNIHWEGLVKNLGGDEEIARKAVIALVEAAAIAQPSGKQNTFAAQNLPDFVMVEVSPRNVPVSYANAFIKPARSSESRSLMDASVEKLAGYVSRISKTFGLEGQRAFIATQEYELPGASVEPSLPALSGWLEKQLAG